MTVDQLISTALLVKLVTCVIRGYKHYAGFITNSLPQFAILCMNL